MVKVAECCCTKGIIHSFVTNNIFIEKPGRVKWKGKWEHPQICVSADPVTPGCHSRAGSSLLTRGKKSFQLPKCPVSFCLQLKYLWSNGFFSFLTFSGITTGIGQLLLFYLDKAAGRGFTCSACVGAAS